MDKDEKADLLKKLAAVIAQIMSEQQSNARAAIGIRGNVTGSNISHNYVENMPLLNVDGNLDDSNVSSNTVIDTTTSELIKALKKLYTMILTCDDKNEEGSRIARWFNEKFPKYAAVGSLGMGLLRFFVAP